MAYKTHLAGRFQCTSLAFLRDRAGRKDDPRNVFYEAMLRCDTYDSYAEGVDGISVTVSAFGDGKKPINRRDEILYARRSGHMVDAPG